MRIESSFRNLAFVRCLGVMDRNLTTSSSNEISSSDFFALSADRFLSNISILFLSLSDNELMISSPTMRHQLWYDDKGIFNNPITIIERFSQYTKMNQKEQVLEVTNTPVKGTQPNGNGVGNFPTSVNRHLVARTLGIHFRDVSNFLLGKRNKVGKKRWNMLKAWAIEHGYLPKPVEKERHECPLCQKKHVIKKG